MQILRSPEGFVATTTLLTQSVGESTGAITLKLVSHSNSCLSLGFNAKGTRLEGDTVGVTLGSTSSRCVPGRVPRSPSKTSWYSLISWSAVFALAVSLLWGILTLATCLKLSGWISRSPTCWLAFAATIGLLFFDDYEFNGVLLVVFWVSDRNAGNTFRLQFWFAAHL